MSEDIKIGKLYKRKKYFTSKGDNNPEKDIVVVMGKTELWKNILYYYLDDPDEICEWNNGAFMDAFEEQ